MAFSTKKLKIDSDLFSRYDHVETIKAKRNIYLIHANGCKYVLKAKRESLNYAIESLTHHYLIKNEIAVYKMLEKTVFEYFNYPELIDTDGKSFIGLRYINSLRKGFDRKITYQKDFIEALVEFHSISLKYNIKGEETIKPNLLENFYYHTNRGMVKILLSRINKLGVINTVKAFLLYMQCQLNQKALDQPLLQHNDLANSGNLITSKDGVIYFIDFASASDEKKWVLNDILDLAFNKKTLEVDSGLFENYLYALKNKIDISKLNLKTQVRFILLKRSLLRLKKKKVGNLYKVFLINTLLDKHAFESWFEKNFKIPENE